MKYLKGAAVSCSPDAYRLGGVGFGFGTMGKLGHAWHGCMGGAWGAWSGWWWIIVSSTERLIHHT